MAIFYMLMGAVLTVLALVIAYYVWALQSFAWIKHISEKHRFLGILVAFVIVLLGLVIATKALSFVNAIIIIVHLVAFHIIVSLLGKLIEHFHPLDIKWNYQGWLSLVICIAYLGAGYYLDHHVWLKEYQIESSKQVGTLKVAMFADSHMGTTFDADGFGYWMHEIEKQQPDVLVISGDYVDDGTSYEDMVKACQVLGRMKLKYGVYYAFGNHDRGYYREAQGGFSGDDMVKELEKNHVHVLVDESVLIDNRFYLIGREDASVRSRKSMKDLVASLDSQYEMIVLNHQPSDYQNEAASQVDLVLSGHTHGGQMFPWNILNQMIGVDDRVYGYEKRDQTHFVVTSGISDWEIRFKTGTRSEYVIVTIQGQE